MKYFFHIGDSKTGTTSIQTALSRNIGTLWEYRALYPEAGKTEAHGVAHHALLTEASAPGPQVKFPTWDAMFKEAETKNPETVIISSEGFANFVEEWRVDRLKSLLNGRDVRFVVFFRRPDQWIEALYAQMVKAPPNFAKLSFEKFTRTTPLRSYQTANILADRFGDESVIAIPHAKDTLPAFLSAVFGSDASSLSEKIVSPANANTSPPRQLLKLFHALNQVGKRVAPHQRSVLYRDIEEAFMEGSLPDDLLTLTNSGDDFGRFSSKERRAFLEKHRPLVERTCHRFGIDFAEFYGLRESSTLRSVLPWVSVKSS